MGSGTVVYGRKGVDGPPVPGGSDAEAEVEAEAG